MEHFWYAELTDYYEMTYVWVCKNCKYRISKPSKETLEGFRQKLKNEKHSIPECHKE